MITNIVIFELSEMATFLTGVYYSQLNKQVHCIILKKVIADRFKLFNMALLCGEHFCQCARNQTAVSGTVFWPHDHFIYLYIISHVHFCPREVSRIFISAVFADS